MLLKRKRSLRNLRSDMGFGGGSSSMFDKGFGGSAPKKAVHHKKHKSSHKRKHRS